MNKVKVLPNLRSWMSSGEILEIPELITVSCSINKYNKLRTQLDQFKRDVFNYTGKLIEYTDLKIGFIHLVLDNENEMSTKEGYKLSIFENVTINSSTTKGIFYGLQTVLQLLSQVGKLQTGTGFDSPQFSDRGFMIDCGRFFFSVEYIKKLIRHIAFMKMNTLHLHFTEAQAFRLKSDLYPGLASEKSYSKQDIRDIQDYAKIYHITIIPEIDIPAHSSAITDYNPNLGFKSRSMRDSKWQGEAKFEDGKSGNELNKAWTLDPTRAEVKDWVRNLLDEWIPLFDSPYFHIGGDEWQYDKEKMACKELVDAAAKKGFPHPGDLFVEWINEINKQVKSYGKTTQIWNWWRFSPTDDMQNKTSIQPDKDIIINVWNAERESQIIEDGYEVILTNEEGDSALYITPHKGEGKAGDYGYFDSKKIYEDCIFNESSNVKGYKVCLWANGAENQSEDWYTKFIIMPLAVFAEKSWGTAWEDSYEDFKNKYNLIGLHQKV